MIFFILLAKIPTQRRGMSGYHPSQGEKKSRPKITPTSPPHPSTLLFPSVRFLLPLSPPPAFALFFWRNLLHLPPPLLFSESLDSFSPLGVEGRGGVAWGHQKSGGRRKEARFALIKNI